MPQHSSALGRAALAQLWQTAGMPEHWLTQARLIGADPILPSSFAVGTAAQSTIAASGLAAAALWEQRGGLRQTVSVDIWHAAIEFRSERYLTVDGEAPADPWDKIAGLYRCADGWVRIHTNFPHHRDGILSILGCAYDKTAVQDTLMQWTAEAFEDAVAERGMVATALRSFAQWDAHPQGIAISQLPIFSIEKIGEAPPQPLPFGPRPLSGVHVLDLTRVIAGPVGCRTLAAHGADVLQITSPNLPCIPLTVIDNGRGKRACHIDLTTLPGRLQLAGLLGEADVFVQGYRPGGLQALGFGPEQAAMQRPGLVYASLSAYGHAGPWAARRGFDSLTQTAAGFNVAEATAAGQTTPRPFPAQVLDHAAGYLLALGSMAALYRRASEGGSWHVRVSLAQTAHWLRGLGRIEGGIACVEPPAEVVGSFLEESDSGFGRLKAVRHAAQLDLTPAHWDLPSVPLGTHAASWAA
ncbi:MAG: CoA transferase [Burkholderiales bacterium]|nr:CoA transferase [Burkholderiales bacterium]